MTEVWKPIPDFPGYEVSDRGGVRSYWLKIGLGRGRGTKQELQATPQRVLRPALVARYLRVTLFRNGKRFSHCTIHSLMLQAFIGPRPVGMEGCHKNGQYLDNTLSNLRWDTKQANSQDSVRHGTHSGFKRKGIKHPGVKLTEQQVIHVRIEANKGVSHTSLARTLGVCPQTVDAICKRKTWAHIA